MTSIKHRVPSWEVGGGGGLWEGVLGGWSCDVVVIVRKRVIGLRPMFGQLVVLWVVLRCELFLRPLK